MIQIEITQLPINLVIAVHNRGMACNLPLPSSLITKKQEHEHHFKFRPLTRDNDPPPGEKKQRSSQENTGSVNKEKEFLSKFIPLRILLYNEKPLYFKKN